MKDDVITLYREVRTQDEYGRWMEGTPVRREVYARVLSISRQEFFDAGQNGLKPAYRFDVFAGDYQGEAVVEYHGATYSIYRTYEAGDYMEMYAERKGGTDGKTNTT